MFKAVFHSEFTMKERELNGKTLPKATLARIVFIEYNGEKDPSKIKQALEAERKEKFDALTAKGEGNVFLPNIKELDTEGDFKSYPFILLKRAIGAKGEAVPVHFSRFFQPYADGASELELAAKKESLRTDKSVLEKAAVLEELLKRGYKIF